VRITHHLNLIEKKPKFLSNSTMVTKGKEKGNTASLDSGNLIGILI
jgi:hypothetical protein